MKTSKRKSMFGSVIPKSAGVALMALLGCIAASPADASVITKTAQGSHIDGQIDAADGGATISIDAESSADFLIVGTSTEFGDGDTFTAKYDGNNMTFATGNGNHSNLFYLDLTTTTYNGGAANLQFSWNHTAGGDLGVGWVSVQAELQAGEKIALHSTGSSDGSTSVDLVTTADSTFNFVNFNANKDGGNPSLGGGLTTIYSDESFGSNGGAAGYEASVAAGTHTYSWNNSNARRYDAASFTVIPEPSTLVLLGIALGSVFFFRRRK